MGYDLTLYPEKITKEELKNFIEDLGFTPCKHVWDWPKGTLNYYWFEQKDFLSIDGVSADIYPVENDETNKTNCNWALHVRTRVFASIYDIKMLNRVLREGRKKFGGDIYGDYGKNRYIPLWKDHSTPISRGLSAVYEEAIQTIDQITFTIPNALFKNPEAQKQNNKLNDLIKRHDPVRFLYNGLVPMAVSVFEFFFLQVFQILLKYDKKALKKIEEINYKVKFKDVLSISKNEKTIESIISETYNFQNIKNLNLAYKEWFGIDIRSILYKKKKIGNRFAVLENRMDEIIKFRHSVIHHFIFNNALNKSDLINIFDTVKSVITTVTDFFESKYKIKIERH